MLINNINNNYTFILYYRKMKKLMKIMLEI